MAWVSIVNSAMKLVGRKEFTAAAQRLNYAVELMGDHPERWVVERWAAEAVDLARRAKYLALDEFDERDATAH